MQQILLVIQLLVALALVGAILLQRSEGGALGIGGGGMMSARGSANLLTRATAVLAAIFLALTMTLAILAGRPSDEITLMQDQTEMSLENFGDSVDESPAADEGEAEEPAEPATPDLPEGD